jgi:hypothetical protein
VRYVVVLLGDKPGSPPRQAWVIDGDEETAKRFTDRVTREVDPCVYLVASQPVIELLGYADMMDTAIRDGLF